MKKTVSLLAVITVIISLCSNVFALETKNSVISPTKTFYQILGIESNEDIKSATIEYVRELNNVCADIVNEDIEKFLSVCRDTEYKAVIGPYWDNYKKLNNVFVNLWKGEKYSLDYNNKLTIYPTCIQYGAYGNKTADAGVTYAYNYLWYYPTEDSVNVIAEAFEELTNKYCNRTRMLDNYDGPVVVKSEPNYFSTAGASKWAETDLQIAATKNLVPYELAYNYTEGISREDFCKLAAQLIVVLYKEKTYDTVNSSEIQSVVKEIIQLKNLTSEFENVLYEDVNNPSDEIRFLTALKVIYGTGKNRFEPNSYITRETAAAILSRIASLFDVELNADGDNFSDDYQISYWAKSYVYEMKNLGVMFGDENNLFNAQDIYTKEQSIITIYRMYQRSFVYMFSLNL